MVDQVKVKSTERNTVELPYDEEYALTAANIPYDNSISQLIADNVQAAIDEILGGMNFSYRFVNKEITIKAEQEMIVSDYIDISLTGTLEVNGLLTLLGV